MKQALELYSFWGSREDLNSSALPPPTALKRLLARRPTTVPILAVCMLQPEPLRRRHAAATPCQRRRGPVPTQPFRLPAQEASDGVRTARRRSAYVSKVTDAPMSPRRAID